MNIPTEIPITAEHIRNGQCMDPGACAIAAALADALPGLDHLSVVPSRCTLYVTSAESGRWVQIASLHNDPAVQAAIRSFDQLGILRPGILVLTPKEVRNLPVGNEVYDMTYREDPEADLVTTTQPRPVEPHA